jgi:tetratricopeptide (TPR) repeat protein
MSKRFTILALFLLLAPAQAFSAATWAAYTTDNFTLYSDADEEEMSALVRNFEVFRLVTLAMLNLADQPENERLTIIVLDTARDFGRIRGGLEAAGFFYHSIYGPRMIIGPPDRAGSRDTLFHEYVHYLMNQRSALNYPLWYREGLASMLETTEIAESAIFVGQPPAGYVRRLALGFDASVHDLVDPDQGKVGGFYPTSWLMTHYLLLGSFSDSARKRSLVDYLRRYDAGEDAVAAFTQSFGVSLGEMRRQITAYGRRGTVPGLEWPRIAYSGRVSRMALEQGQHLHLLGDIAVERELYAAAHYYFDRFEELDWDSPLRTSVMSRRAIAYAHDEKIDEGDAILDQLLALDVSEPAVLADIAHYEFDRYTYDRDNGGDSGLLHLDRSIEYGKRAVAGDPEDIEALYYLGLANELKGNLQVAADTLLEAYDLSPSIPRLNINLARVLVKGGQKDLAAYLVSRLYSATHSDEGRELYRTIRKEIEDGNVDLKKLDPP